MANGFLAVRIYTLTNCRLEPGLVFGLSFSAFIAGLVTIATNWPSRSNGFTVSGRAMSVVWRALQVVTECHITYFLSRVLLASRSGIQKSDHIVNHLVRNGIQLGLFATLWAIAGMATWLLLPQSWVYTVFDMTSGSIYTHMIYDGLLSRTRLRECMVERNLFALGLPSQSLSHTFEGKRSSRVPRAQVAISQVTVTDFGTTTQNASGASGIDEENNSELGCSPVGKSAVGYDILYKE
ncbi:hypothetical protein BJV78DRAFT_1254852 [Lactifluus subvellereus]|nr:hypothetical protein BJV78DRAFT_1254852 [Lactifluus subvellereus]